MAAMAVIGGVQAVTGIVGTIAGIGDAQRRRETEAAMGLLSLSQQMSLERDLGRARTQTERLKILTDAVSMIRSAEVTQKLANQGKEQEAKRKKERITIYLVVGGGIATLLTVILIRKL